MGFQAPNLITFSYIVDSDITVTTIRPNGDGGKTQQWGYVNSIGIIVYSPLDHYIWVDDVTCDDSDGFVASVRLGDLNELYEFENISVPTNYVIDYVTIISAALASENITGLDYEYRLSFSPDSGTTIYESDPIQVKQTTNLTKFKTTSFGLLSWNLTKNPDTGLDWTESDINSAQFGTTITNVLTSGEAGGNFNLRPVGHGNSEQLTPNGALHGWQCTDDSHCGSSVYVYNDNADSTYYYDLYGMDYQIYIEYMQNSISNVTVTIQTWQDDIVDQFKCKTVIRTHATNYYGAEENCVKGTPCSEHTTSYDTNPFNGMPWNWLDILTLQAGVALKNVAAGSSYCCEVKITVTVGATHSPVIATSQIYAYVGMHSSVTYTCELPSPVDFEVVHDADTMALNFWSGNREVYSLGRRDKKLVLKGLMWDGCTDGTTSCEDIISCIRNMGKLQVNLTLTGMRYSYLNTVYNIIAFSWKEMHEKPKSYEWMMELEFVN